MDEMTFRYGIEWAVADSPQVVAPPAWNLGGKKRTPYYKQPAMLLIFMFRNISNNWLIVLQLISQIPLALFCSVIMKKRYSHVTPSFLIFCSYDLPFLCLDAEWFPLDKSYSSVCNNGWRIILAIIHNSIYWALFSRQTQQYTN
jgi:hypothetical protein